MVGRVVDRRGPDLAQAEVAGDRHVAGQALAIALVRRPVDLARHARLLVRVAPPEEQAALFESPVQSGGQVEDHRHALDVEGVMGFGDGDGVAGRAGRDAQPREVPDRSQRRAAGQEHALRFDAAFAGLHARHPGAVVGRAQSREGRPLAELDTGLPASRASTPARCAADRRSRHPPGNSRRDGHPPRACRPSRRPRPGPASGRRSGRRRVASRRARGRVVRLLR